MTGNRENRLFFLDNVRVFVIAFVIMQHVAILYNPHSREPNLTGTICGYIVSVTDVFMIPIMFFIAGYFALSSIRGRGASSFLVGKFRRIFLPWLAGVTLLVPPSVFLMRFVSAQTPHGGYGTFWLKWMRSAARFHTGAVTSSDLFSHRHLWFLSVLFWTFVVFALLYAVSGRFPAVLRKSAARLFPRERSVLSSLLALGILSGTGFFAIKLCYAQGYQATQLLGLLHFDPARLVFNGVWFAYGVYAAAGEWFSREHGPGNYTLWAAVCLLSLAFYSWIVLTDMLPENMTGKVLSAVLRTLLCLSLFVTLVWGARSRWNGGSAISRLLASNSYTIYIIHYLFLAALAALWARWNVPPGVKAILAYAAASLLSCVAAEYLVKRRPGWSVAGLAAMNGLLALVL